MIDEMDLLSRAKDTPPLRAGAFDNARTTLRAAMALDADLQKQPRTTSDGVRRQARWTGRRAGFGVTAVAAAAAAAVALVVTSSPAPRPPAVSNSPSASGSQPTARAVSPSATAPNPELAQLASYIEVHRINLPGNASLEVRNQSPVIATPGANGVDLLTDSGDYYWALTVNGLPQAIAEHEDPSDGMFKREVAAALFAVHGNIATARARMAVANFAPGITPKQITPLGTQAQRAANHNRPIAPPRSKPLTKAQQADNEIWSNSLDALNAGAANPQVRVGVLRLLATVPQVTVSNTVTGGQPSLTLAETFASPSGPAQELLVIDAGTGLPIVTMTRQPGGQLTGVTYYHVSRVTLADIAAGRS